MKLKTTYEYEPCPQCQGTTPMHFYKPPFTTDTPENYGPCPTCKGVGHLGNLKSTTTEIINDTEPQKGHAEP